MVWLSLASYQLAPLEGVGGVQRLGRHGRDGRRVEIGCRSGCLPWSMHRADASVCSAWSPDDYRLQFAGR